MAQVNLEIVLDESKNPPLTGGIPAEARVLLCKNHTNSILKHGIEHSRFFVPAKLSEVRRTGGTHERNEAKPGRKRCCANDMV